MSTPMVLTRSTRPDSLHRLLAVVVAASLATALLASCSSDSGSDSQADTTETSAAGDEPPPCPTDLSQTAGSPTAGPVKDLVDSLVAAADLPDARGYANYRIVCDNVGVTKLVAPNNYDYVEPSESSPPQSGIRVGRDFLGPVEEGPIIQVFAVPVGGTAYPTQPNKRVWISDTAAGSLSSGTRDPREGDSIAEDCEALPAERFATDELSGASQFFVDCGGDNRAWVGMALSPTNGDPYFVWLLAQTLTVADAQALGRALNTLTFDGAALSTYADETERASTTTTESGPTTTR